MRGASLLKAERGGGGGFGTEDAPQRPMVATCECLRLRRRLKCDEKNAIDTVDWPMASSFPRWYTGIDVTCVMV